MSQDPLLDLFGPSTSADPLASVFGTAPDADFTRNPLTPQPPTDLGAALQGKTKSEAAAQTQRELDLRDIGTNTQQQQQPNEESEGFGTYVGDLARSAASGAVSAVGMGIRGIGEGSARMRDLLARSVGPDKVDDFIQYWLAPAVGQPGLGMLLNPNVSKAVTGAGQGVQNVADAVNVAPEKQNYTGNIIANATGQLAGLIAISAVGGESAVDTSLIGQGFDQVDQGLKQGLGKQKGTDQLTKAGDIATLAGGPVIAALEKTGLDQVMEGIPVPIKNRVIRGLADTMMVGGFEAGEEVAQQIVQNFATKLGLAPDTPVRDWPKDLGEGLEPNAVGGFGAGFIARALMGRWGAHRPVMGQSAEAPMGMREAGALQPEITPDDEASPLPTDLIVQGKMTVGAAEGTTKANQVLSASGLPQVGTRVTVSHNGRTQQGAISDAYTVNVAGQDSPGVKIRLDDGTMIEEPIDTLRDMGVKITPVNLPSGLPAQDLANPVVQQFAGAGMQTVEGADQEAGQGALGTQEMAGNPAKTPADQGLHPGNLPQDVVKGLVAEGIPSEIARGVAAGVVAESGNDETVSNAKSGAFGLGQWLGARKQALFNRFGPNPTRAQQIEFLAYELKGGDPGGASVLSASNKDEALQRYITDFMRPGKGAETAGDLERGRAALGSKPGTQGDLFGGEQVTGTQMDARRAVEEHAEANEDADAGELMDNAHAILASDAANDQDYVGYHGNQLGSLLGTAISPTEAPDYARAVLQKYGDTEQGRGVVGPTTRDLPEGYQAFGSHTGTLDIPREQMPQIKAEHRGAMVNFLNARGISHEEVNLPAHSLKPSQTEFSPEKVKAAKEFTGGDRAILIDENNHVVDGHHQFVAAHDRGQSLRAIRLNAPVDKIASELRDMPSAETAGTDLSQIRDKNEQAGESLTSGQQSSNHPFDAEAFDRERNDTIKASRAAGNVHLDQIPAAVETMRGKEIYYAHDPQVRGVVRTVSNTGDVVVHWSDAYSAKKEMAAEKQEGGKTVNESWLQPHDLKDYVVANPSKQDAMKAKMAAKGGASPAGIEASREAGRKAFERGDKRVPPSFLPNGYHQAAWLEGWDKANLSAPVEPKSEVPPTTSDEARATAPKQEAMKAKQKKGGAKAAKEAEREAERKRQEEQSARIRAENEARVEKLKAEWAHVDFTKPGAPLPPWNVRRDVMKPWVVGQPDYSRKREPGQSYADEDVDGQLKAMLENEGLAVSWGQEIVYRLEPTDKGWTVYVNHDMSRPNSHTFFAGQGLTREQAVDRIFQAPEVVEHIGMQQGRDKPFDLRIFKDPEGKFYYRSDINHHNGGGTGPSKGDWQYADRFDTLDEAKTSAIDAIWNRWRRIADSARGDEKKDVATAKKVHDLLLKHMPGGKRDAELDKADLQKQFDEQLSSLNFHAFGNHKTPLPRNLLNINFRDMPHKPDWETGPKVERPSWMTYGEPPTVASYQEGARRTYQRYVERFGEAPKLPTNLEPPGELKDSAPTRSWFDYLKQHESEGVAPLRASDMRGETKATVPEPPENAPEPEPTPPSSPSNGGAEASNSTVLPSGYGASNKIFTREAADKARALILDKLKTQLNSGFDPDLLSAGIQLAGYHIEAGARSFAAFSKALAEDLGTSITKLKPYLAAWYNGSRDTLEGHGEDISGMDGPGAVRAALSMIADSGTEEAANADQGNAPASPEGQGSATIQPAEPQRAAGSVGAGEAANGERAVRPADAGRGEATERSGEGSGVEAVRRGAGESGGARRSDGRRSAEGARHAGERTGPVNFSIEPGALEESRGPKQKARDNVAAIRIVKQLAAEDRFATPEEQAAIAKYVGWGGLKNVFPDVEGNYGKGFEDIGAEIADLLTPEEYETARRSIQYAHFTAEKIVRSMWDAAQRLGFEGGAIFEPGMGVGNFAGMMPDELKGASLYQGVEMDGITAQIAKALYPKYGVSQADFTQYDAPKDAYRLVIGNPPFSETVVKADPAYRSLGLVLHDYFFAKSLDAVHPGGALLFVTSTGTMNKLDTKAREYLAERAWLAGAIRLPGGAFAENAGTEVSTDIVALVKKTDANEPRPTWAAPHSWVETVERDLPTKEGTTQKGAISRYFDEHPEMVLGRTGFFDRLWPNRIEVQSDGRDLTKALKEAIDRLPEGASMNISPATARSLAALPATDFDVEEAKNGSYYLKDGELYQKQGGVGRKVETKGKGSKTGLTEQAQSVVRDLIPIRDHLRRVYSHDLAAAQAKDPTLAKKNAEAARRDLNDAYDTFVSKHGPINKGIFTPRRPNRVQIESARMRAREEARSQGHEWDDGTFDPSDLRDSGASIADIARIRAEMKAEYAAQGRPWSDGSFSDDEVPDTILEKRPNIDPFKEDPENYRLRSIEHYDDQTGEAKKGRVFFESVIAREEEPDIKNATDALYHVLNKTGRVDLDEVAKLAGTSPADAATDLAGQVFLNPENKAWEHSTQYLAGNVRQKLATARAALASDQRYQANVDALEAVMPPELGKSDVRAVLGMPWIPESDVKAFAMEELGLSDFHASYSPRLATWSVAGDKNSAAATSTYGTNRRSATELMGDALNGATPKIFDTYRDSDGSTHSVLNTQETQAAQDKQAQIKEKFEDWLFRDDARAERLLKIYNERFNSFVAPEWSGDYLTTPGVTASWKWRPHQLRGIARIVQAGNTYLAHAVGAGKTATMIGGVMEQRRLGLVNKPMIAVPNHMLGQFTKEFYELYPLAKLAIADEENFHTDKRKQFVSDVALNDLDAVIITHSALGLVPMSQEFERRFLMNELAELRATLNEIKSSDEDQQTKNITRRKVEQSIEQAEQRMRAVTTRRRDQTFTFEQLGVDQLLVDEAHLFRKLDFATRRGNIKGIDPNGSMRSMDLYMKTRYLEQRKPGRSHVLASGTPITNTMAELFTISRYLQPDELRERGIDRFDSWAGSFGNTKSELEPTAGGTYKMQTRFSEFVNVPELSVMVRQVMDVVTGPQLEQYVVRPKVKRELILVPQTPSQSAYQSQLAARMEAIEQRKGKPKKGDDIILNVIGDGRKSAIDMRLVDPSHTVEPSKLERLIDNAHKVWEETRKQPFYGITPNGYTEQPATHGRATQMIFSSLGVSDAMEFNVHRYIRDSLVKRGVPKDQVVLFNQIKTTVAKQKVFNDMNAGKVAFLIGSVDKMGTGVNAQKRLYANHNLDPEWLPSSDEQRNGRIVRQGNTNREVRIFDYATKGTYDEQMWGIMARKARFIEGFFRGDPTLRTIEDLGEASTYEQAKALVAKDPRILELAQAKLELEKEIRRRNAHDQEQATAKRKAVYLKAEKEAEQSRLALEEADAAKNEPIKGDSFKAVLNGKSFDDRGDFQEALDKAMKADTLRRGINNVGTIGGHTLALLVSDEERTVFDKEDGTADHRMVRSVDPALLLANDPQSVEARYMRLSTANTAVSAQAALDRIARQPDSTKQRIASLEKQQADFEERAANIKPYEGLAKIRELQEKTTHLTNELANENAKVEEAKRAKQQPQGEVKSQAAAPQKVELSGTDVERIRNGLLQRMAELGINDRVSLEAADGLRLARNDTLGQYDAWNRVLSVALDRSPNPLHTVNHEAVHAIGPNGLHLITPSEWSVLVERAWEDDRLREWAQRSAAYQDLSEEDQKEEAAAEFFADTIDRIRGIAIEGRPLGKLEGVAERAAYRVARFLNALRHAVSYLRTGKAAELRPIDVVLRIDHGEVGRRKRFGGRTPTVTFGKKGILSQAEEVRPREFGLPRDETPIAAFNNTKHVQTELKAHPDYKAAKAGDMAAAIRLVDDLVPQRMLDEVRQRFAGATFAPVLAEEASGDNAIPLALAAKLADYAGGDVTDRIVQSEHAFHTGAGAMERLTSRPLFSGEVEKGGRYVLVDDVAVMGGSLAELANHIQQGGGEVIGTALLVNASRNPVLGVNKLRSGAVERRFGDVVRNELGVEPSALTGPESAYLLNFKDADTLRGRIAKAKDEREARIRSRPLSEERAPQAEGIRPLDRYIETRDALEGDPDLEDNGDAEEGGDLEDENAPSHEDRLRASESQIRAQAAPPPPAGQLFPAGVEERWNDAAKGIGDGPGMFTKMNLAAQRIGQALSRHWINLPNVPKYAELQQELRKLEAAPQAAKEKAVRHLREVVKGLTREDLDLFTRKVVTDDLAWEAEQDRELPFGFTPETLAEARQAVEAELAQKPNVLDAVRKRKALNRQVAQDLVGSGVLDAERLKNPAYYRHVVLDYARAEAAAARVAGVGKKLRSPRWARRMGSEKDINANYLEAEFDWLAKALVDIPTAKAISWIGDSEHNILPTLREQAKQHNKAMLDKMLEREREAFEKGDLDAMPLDEAIKGFKQRIAMGFKFVEDAIEANHVEIPPQLEKSFAALGTGKGDPFPFLSWLLDNNQPGSNGAAVILKAISQRRVFTAKVLGRNHIDPTDAEELVKRLAPEGYSTWSPDDARLLFTVRTMPEHAIDAMLEKIDAAPGVSGDDVRAMLESVRSALAFGGMRYSMILPNEVASTLNKLRREDLRGLFDSLAEEPLKRWKQWVLINPRRVAKYNLNNFSGDLDATIAGRGPFNRQFWSQVGPAALEIAQVMRGKAQPSARYEEAIERGVFDSGLSIQEIPDINRLSAFADLSEGAGLRPDRIARKVLNKAWNALRGGTQWRENVLRYAAYREYVHRLEAGEGMLQIGYGGSLPKMVDAVKDPRDRAALLARDLLGDYGAVSQAGQEIRRKLIPFWSWMEINTKRYWRLSSNAFAEGTMKGLATGGLLGAGAAFRTTMWLGVRMGLLYGLMQLWNHWRYPEEEKELGEQQERQLHIIIGRSDDGRIQSLRLQGALSDALSWFGLSDAADAMQNYELGRGPWYDVLLAPPKATINKLGTALSPLFTIPFETISGKKLYPDLFATRFIRDRWRNLFQTFSLDNEYDLLLGKPSRGYAQSWIGSLTYTTDPGEEAYNEARGITYDWLKRVKGQTDPGGYVSDRATALYNWRASRKFGDKQAEEKALDRLEELGVTKGDLKRSIRAADPLGPIPKKDRKAFLSQLTDDELTTMERAEDWYKQRFLQGPAQ